MPDMLVRLYDMPDCSADVQKLAEAGIVIRRVLAPEKHAVKSWVEKHFNAVWGSEAEKAMMNTPSSCYIAIEDGYILGFACHDATCRNFFGPTGVSETARGRGVGKGLLWVTLRSMQESGYAYAIIGGVGPAEFYTKSCGATIIEGSTPGIFNGLIFSLKEEGATA